MVKQVGHSDGGYSDGGPLGWWTTRMVATRMVGHSDGPLDLALVFPRFASSEQMECSGTPWHRSQSLHHHDSKGMETQTK